MLPRKPRPTTRPRACFRRLTAESLEPRAMLAGLPYGALETDTAEYLLGDVLVNLVLLESQNVTSGSDTENWTPALIEAVKSKAEVGMQWWVDTLHQYHPDAYLNFEFDFTHADAPFEVPFEPINRTSNEHTAFVDLFLDAQGFTFGSELNRIYEYNNAQRVAHGTDWAFTIFVVNDTNDPNQAFAAGGSFSKSFAYPGGRYIVTLADRPSEIYAHETGHIFWAMDEYSNGSSYSETRGYYNTQNLNGTNGAPPGHVQQTSLMASNSSLTLSYINHTLPQATREHVGWRDSDGDGIIDVLDVPLTLNGQGFVDPQNGNYRFVGSSQVQTLPNKNAASSQSDITLNKVRVAEYRIDGGDWTTAAAYDAPSAELNLSIPLVSGAQEIEIRTRDTRTGVTSSVFSSSIATPTWASESGIGGFVFQDRNSNGAWDGREIGLANREVRLLDANHQPLAGPLKLLPDTYPDREIVTNILPGVTLRAIGSGVAYDEVEVRDATLGDYTSRVFGNFPNSGQRTQWDYARKLRIDFAQLQTVVSINAVGAADGSLARLEAYDSNNQLIGRVTSAALGLGEVETLTFGRAQGDIKYVLVAGHGGKRVALDDLRIGPEVVTTTNSFGGYLFPMLAAGTYYVEANVPSNWTSTTPANSQFPVTYVAGQPLASASFGQRLTTYTWQNPLNRLDVNGDNSVDPLDALILIIDINAIGVRELTEPPPSGEDPPTFVDVNGDGYVTPLDALELIIYLNSSGGNAGSSEPAGSAPSAAAAAPANGPASSPQGEAGHQGESHRQFVPAATADLVALTPLRDAFPSTAAHNATPHKAESVTPATEAVFTELGSASGGWASDGWVRTQQTPSEWASGRWALPVARPYPLLAKPASTPDEPEDDWLIPWWAAPRTSP